MKFKDLILRPLMHSHFVARFGAWILKSIYRLNTWVMKSAPNAEKLTQGDQNFIVCFWHGRMAMIPFARKNSRRFKMLLSNHIDGKLIGRIVQNLGIEAIYGSTNRGGRQALRELLRAADEGYSLGFTPDGPRGPVHQISLGTLMAAKLSNLPILPITFSTSRRRILNFWDKFHLPLPFGRGVILCGEPLFVPSSASKEQLEAYRQTLQQRMLALNEEADRLCNHAPSDG